MNQKKNSHVRKSNFSSQYKNRQKEIEKARKRKICRGQIQSKQTEQETGDAKKESCRSIRAPKAYCKDKSNSQEAVQEGARRKKAPVPRADIMKLYRSLRRREKVFGERLSL